MANHFATATRLKLRFQHKGLNNVEKLWDLGLTELDEIYRGLMKEKRELEGDSLLTTRNTGTRNLETKIGCVREVVEYKQSKVRDAERRAQIRKLEGIKERKKEAELEGRSIAEIDRLIEQLGG